jgi:hypothetical protein
VISAAAGYVAASLALTLIKHFGATNTEVAKSLRKVVQVLTSVLVYSKSVGWHFSGGLILVALSLAWMHRIYKAEGGSGRASTSIGEAGAVAHAHFGGSHDNLSALPVLWGAGARDDVDAHGGGGIGTGTAPKRLRVPAKV